MSLMRLFTKMALVAIILIFSTTLLNGQETMLPPVGYINMKSLVKAYRDSTFDYRNPKSRVIPKGISQHRDIVFKVINDDSVKLDIFFKKDISKPRPLIVLVHGGGWKMGKKENFYPYAGAFAKDGYITATVNYRLAPHAHFPSQIEDVKCSINWLIKHATEYNIDADKIILVGSSAGAHLALLAAYSNDDTFRSGCDTQNIRTRIKGVIDIYGPTDMAREPKIRKSSVVNLIGASYEDKPKAYKAASPMNYISENCPPTMILHGTIDGVVPVRHSDLLNSELSRFGVPTDYHRLKGWGHVMDRSQAVYEYHIFYMREFIKSLFEE